MLQSQNQSTGSSLKLSQTVIISMKTKRLGVGEFTVHNQSRCKRLLMVFLGIKVMETLVTPAHLQQLCIVPLRCVQLFTQAFQYYNLVCSYLALRGEVVSYSLFIYDRTLQTCWKTAESCNKVSLCSGFDKVQVFHET